MGEVGVISEFVVQVPLLYSEGDIRLTAVHWVLPWAVVEASKYTCCIGDIRSCAIS